MEGKKLLLSRMSDEVFEKIEWGIINLPMMNKLQI
jgi:hypothetical protein